MDFLVQSALPLTLALMMLSLGLGLTPTHFKQIVQRPKSFWSGFSAQIVLAPLVAFSIVTIFGLTGSVAVGFMILGACPGGGVSNLISKLGRGNVALSVTLTATSTLTCVLTMPIVVIWSVAYFTDESVQNFAITDIVLRNLFVCIVPILLGLMVRIAQPNLAVCAEKVLTKVSAVLLAAIIIAAVASSWALFVAHLWHLGAALVLMALSLAGLGFAVSRLFKLDPPCARTISIELGIQNGAFGIAVAALLHTDVSGFGESALASALYGVLMYFFIIPLAFWYRSRAR